MTDRLPPMLSRLFKPRDPIEYKEPMPLPKELNRNARPLTGLAGALQMLEKHKDANYKHVEPHFIRKKRIVSSFYFCYSTSM